MLLFLFYLLDITELKVISNIQFIKRNNANLLYVSNLCA